MQAVARAVVFLEFLVAAVFALSLAVPVAAQSAVPGAGSWSPGPDGAGDNTYAGFVDQPANGATIAAGATFHVSGWIVDTAADGWAGIDGVQVLNGSTVLGQGVVGLNRPDVASVTGNPYWAASGFDVVVPGNVPTGAANLTVAAHTPGKGTWTRQLSVTISGTGAVITSPTTGSGLVLSVTFPGPNMDILANNNGFIYGVASDSRTRAELGVGVDWVEVDLDGPRGVAGSQNLGTATQNGNTWMLMWEPTKYDHVRQHTLFVYAHSSVTGEIRLLNVPITIEPS